jgi:3'-phosphoadenosine 5'-phosphosulfate sulfotransferase (PAPS reductase)/FAD synthetase
MNIVGYGGGTNSTAMLIGLYHKGIPVDLILFSDTGGEQPHTYEYLAHHGPMALGSMECLKSRRSNIWTKTATA